MTENNKYRPAFIEFDVAPDGTPVPETLIEVETADQAIVFMNQFFHTNQAITVARHMDNFEKSELRKKYNAILEDRLPEIESDIREKTQTYNEAKHALSNAVEMNNSYLTEAKLLAIEVKRGTSEMRLDEAFTWKLPYKGRFYFFTFIDKKIRLVRIVDMTPTEKNELFSQGKINEDLFDLGNIKAIPGSPTNDEKESKPRSRNGKAGSQTGPQE